METNYVRLYNKVENELKTENITDSLLKVCSVYQDGENENQVNVIFLGGLGLDTIRETKSRFDNYSSDFGFTINYPNLSGKDIFEKED